MINWEEVTEEELLALLPKTYNLAILKPSQLYIIKLWLGEDIKAIRSIEDCSRITGMAETAIFAILKQAIITLRQIGK